MEPTAPHNETLTDALRQALSEEMRRDARVIVLGEDIVMGGVFQVTTGLRREFGRSRVWDMPLAESAIVGISIGAAIAGMRPVAEIQFADYLFGAMQQIVNEAAKIRYRSRGAWTCPIVIRAPYGGGVGGGPDHSQSIEGLFAAIPGLKVVIPSNPVDAKGLLKAAIRADDPVVFLEPKRLYRHSGGPLPDEGTITPLGVANIQREGKDLSIITYGAMVVDALAASQTLAADGIDCEIIDLRTLLPLDHQTIITSVRKTRRAIVAHEAPRFAGFGAEIAALIGETCFDRLLAPVVRVGALHVPIAASPALEQAILPDAATLVQAARSFFI